MDRIREELKAAVKDLYGLDFEPELTPSPENITADYSSNAPLKLAKELHKPPTAIAEELNEKLNANISAPGFLNFTLSDNYLSEKLNELDFTLNEYNGKTIICEFSDPNPFKVLHVGHLYTSIVGDSIARLFESAGAKVIRANFGGDVGLNVAKTMYIFKQKPLDELTIDDIAKCYVEGTAAYEDDENAKAEITKLNKEIYRINSEGLRGGGDDGRPRPTNSLAELYWKGRELSYAYFKDFYAKIGVKFDKYYPESTVAGLGLKKVKENPDVYEKSAGAIIFNGEKFGLHTRVFINQEGVPTYETKDVGLIFQKYEDYHFDKSVVITGSEQLEYMKVVLKSIEQYAPELVKKTAHLTHGLVKLPGNVKMSSRKGNFLKAVDVLDLIRTELKKEYNSTDETVALAATKYAFLKYKMGGNIIFDPKESVKMTGNSGPYLLYSCVRAKKILQKEVASAGVSDDVFLEKVNSRKDMSGITPSEHNLAKKILEYKLVLSESVAEMAPHKLANYLYELAQSFSRFYENCPVVGDKNEPERLKLVQAYLDTMTHGLDILGIKIPE
ncbi:arginine--tRNA ligase [Candidatus Saccharibacteria bacterium]|nr:arginine--tRNA ligase [Candidatus Saccharibacteria bacterium]